MYSIKALPEFTNWLDNVKDAAVRGVVVARIKRLEPELMGTWSPSAKASPNFVFIRVRDGACISRSADASCCPARWRLEAHAKN